MHKSTIKKIIGILAAITVVMVIGILIKENNNKDNNDNNNVSEQPSTAKPVINKIGVISGKNIFMTNKRIAIVIPHLSCPVIS